METDINGGRGRKGEGEEGICPLNRGKIGISRRKSGYLEVVLRLNRDRGFFLFLCFFKRIYDSSPFVAIIFLFINSFNTIEFSFEFPRGCNGSSRYNFEKERKEFFFFII